MFDRIKAVYGIGPDAQVNEKVVTYDDVAYKFQAQLVSVPVRGVAISILVCNA